MTWVFDGSTQGVELLPPQLDVLRNHRPLTIAARMLTTQVAQQRFFGLTTDQPDTAEDKHHMNLGAGNNVWASINGSFHCNIDSGAFGYQTGQWYSVMVVNRAATPFHQSRVYGQGTNAIEATATDGTDQGVPATITRMGVGVERVLSTPTYNFHLAGELCDIAVIRRDVPDAEWQQFYKGRSPAAIWRGRGLVFHRQCYSNTLFDPGDTGIWRFDNSGGLTRPGVGPWPRQFDLAPRWLPLVVRAPAVAGGPLVQAYHHRHHNRAG